MTINNLPCLSERNLLLFYNQNPELLSNMNKMLSNKFMQQQIPSKPSLSSAEKRHVHWWETKAESLYVNKQGTLFPSPEDGPIHLDKESIDASVSKSLLWNKSVNNSTYSIRKKKKKLITISMSEISMRKVLLTSSIKVSGWPGYFLAKKQK